MRRSLALLLFLMCASGCALIPPMHPENAYYPSPSDSRSLTISYTLYRAAQASGDDPTRYSFAFIQTAAVTAFAADDATFYFSDGLARQSQRCILAPEPDLDDRLAALEPLEPTPRLASRPSR